MSADNLTPVQVAALNSIEAAFASSAQSTYEPGTKALVTLSPSPLSLWHDKANNALHVMCDLTAYRVRSASDNEEAVPLGVVDPDALETSLPRTYERLRKFCFDLVYRCLQADVDLIHDELTSTHIDPELRSVDLGAAMGIIQQQRWPTPLSTGIIGASFEASGTRQAVLTRSGPSATVMILSRLENDTSSPPTGASLQEGSVREPGPAVQDLETKLNSVTLNGFAWAMAPSLKSVGSHNPGDICFVGGPLHRRRITLCSIPWGDIHKPPSARASPGESSQDSTREDDNAQEEDLEDDLDAGDPELALERQ